MYLIILAAVAGVISGTLWSQLTIFILTCVLLALAIASVLARRRNVGQLILVFVLVQAWSCLWLGAQLSHRLPIDFDKAPVHIAGCVKAPPEYSTPDSGQGLGQEKGQRQGERPFVRLVLELTPNDYSRGGLRQARLSWYEPPAGLQTGSCIEGEARLRSPRNFANGLSFDYEANLIYRRIDAIGYLQSAHVTNDLLQTQPEPKPKAEVSSNNRATDAWVRGLVFGDKSAFSSDQWQLVRDTGTLHLLVVSGLHVGMVALAFALLAVVLVRLLLLAGVPLSQNRLTSRIAGILPPASALIGAGGYVLIAGAGIPLQRAWLMLLLMVLIWLYPKRIDRLAGLGLVAVAVLLINPLSWTQAGFWYSFSAVAILLLVFEGRVTSRASALLLPQLAIVFAMFPLSLWLDAQPGVVFVIANLIAVPMVSLLLLPAAFAVALGVPWSSDVLLMLSDLFWSLIALVDQMALPQITLHGVSVFILFGVVMLWLSGGRTGLLLCGVAVLIPALVLQKPSPEAGVWLLDSGQGQSLVVSDGQSAAVFDTGPAFSPSFSIASAVAIPMLRK
ncbi:MAG: ComEC/Rec2 family competence protein, partial [Thalassolituus sp.]